ncbi:MAG TPA: TIGR03435 family protein [Terriglobia bacterium]|jgi:uncharacterized protein (TIGR03435 family)
MSEEQNIAIALKCLLPSDEQTEQACGRVSERLQSTVAWEEDARGDELFSTKPGFPWQRTIAITAAGLILMIISASVLQVLRSRGTLDSRIVRSNDANKIVNLSDGSQIEMRAYSEMALENADDGLRVRLNDGGVIIHAAKQRHGHLYVETADVLVSVTGTVFFVSAETSGSRVAVIEGSVQVQQGTQSSELTAGKQLSTRATMSAIAIAEEISWSRRAPEYLALLPQAKEQAPAIQPVNPPGGANSTGTAAFEVASIHIADPSRGGGRGAGPQACGGDIQLEPRRFIANAVTLYRLIAIAYGKDCIFLEQNGDLLQGGPDWVRSDGFVIQALMPEGSPVYIRPQLDTGHAPILQRMILTLLADRFKLAVRTVTKEMPVYSLLPITGTTKLVPWKEGEPSRGFVGMAGRGEQRSFHIMGGKKSMADLAVQLQDATRRTVLDRTGISGEFNYDIQYAPIGSQVGAETDGLSGPSLFTAIQEQLGLKVEATRAPVEVLTIDRALRPSEN